MVRKVTITDVLANAEEVVLQGTNTGYLKLAKPLVGGDADVWGSNGWSNDNDTAIGLNDNSEILDYHVPSRKGTPTNPRTYIENGWDFGKAETNGGVLTIFEGLVDKETAAVRFHGEAGANTARVDAYFGDPAGHGDGTLDFALNYHNAGGGVNLYINGANGDVHISTSLVLEGNLILEGDYVEFPNSEPGQIAGDVDGALAFDSSRGLIINRLNESAGPDGNVGVHTIIDTKMVQGGNGITILNTAAGISGVESIVWEVDQTIVPTLDTANTFAEKITINDVLDVNRVLANAGAVTTPSHSYANKEDCGLYWNGNYNQIAHNGVKAARFDAQGTGVSDDQTVMTKEKFDNRGDGRWAPIDGGFAADPAWTNLTLNNNTWVSFATLGFVSFTYRMTNTTATMKVTVENKDGSQSVVLSDIDNNDVGDKRLFSTFVPSGGRIKAEWTNCSVTDKRDFR